MTRPSVLASEAAEAVRQLIHSTVMPGDAAGYTYPSDVDETLGDLHALVDRLPQALRQMSRWLAAQAAAGLVRHDGYPDRGESAHQARCAQLVLADHLDAAAGRLIVVAADLARARSQSTHLAAFIEDLDDNELDDRDGAR